MTETQARQYIQQAERTGKFTEKKLREAIDALDAGRFGSGDSTYVRRALNLIEQQETEPESLKPDTPTVSDKAARDYVLEAEQLPPEEVDLDRLRDAQRALTDADYDWNPRIQRIIKRITEAGASTRAEREIVGRKDPRTLPRARENAEQAVAEAGAQALPASLLNRLYQAADRAGVSNLEVRQIIADAKAAESGGGQQQIIDPSTGQPIPMGEQDQVLPSAEELLEEQIALWTQGAIGVPEGYVATPTRSLPTARAGGVQEGLDGTGRYSQGRESRTTEVVPRYYSGDNLQLAGLPPERIVQIQRQFEQAGLLDFEGYYAGVWDEETAGAMQSLMGMANASGKTWEQQLDFLQRTMPESVKEARNRDKAAQLAAESFIAPPYMKPDYATLAQDVKGLMRSKLGREPTDEEMAELTGGMSQAYRQEYEAEVAAMRADFDASRAYEDQILADIEAGGTGEGIAPPGVGTFQSVDPTARFQEQFDRRFRPELDFIEGQEDTIANAQNVMSSLLNMSRLIG